MSHNNEHGRIQDALERSLVSEREKLQREIKTLSQEIDARTRERRSKEQRLRHVLALLEGETPTVDAAVGGRRADSASTPSPQILDMVEQVLRERKGEPMHYRELADEIMRRGAVIGGKDPAAALVSRMTQADRGKAESEKRFVRPTSRGFYALREDYPTARNVGARRRGKATSS